uniref:Uncharacterized protein n=1 Tax=Siphoviridae sp. ctHiz26 TaxID=2825423 RepID=A0A8S5Q6R3_9CAUD|nr:MAG TPA: hypothetical protein [Siphoviridae sp. ctHiz26]DAH49779.1 MAG TPA: hypothetical protein [Caudoviricetes sp.]
MAHIIPRRVLFVYTYICKLPVKSTSLANFVVKDHKI